MERRAFPVKPRSLLALLNRHRCDRSSEIPPIPKATDGSQTHLKRKASSGFRERSQAGRTVAKPLGELNRVANTAGSSFWLGWLDVGSKPKVASAIMQNRPPTSVLLKRDLSGPCHFTYERHLATPTSNVMGPTSPLSSSNRPLRQGLRIAQQLSRLLRLFARADRGHAPFVRRTRRSVAAGLAFEAAQDGRPSL